MRPKLGRPNLDAYAGAFTVPPASDRTPASVTFLGVTTLLFSEGGSAVLTDGFFSRPRLRRVLAGRIAPDVDEIGRCLRRAGVDGLDAVVPVHSHYDHALDSAAVAARTGATLVGGESTVNLGRGHGLATDRLVRAEAGTPHVFGSFELTFVESRHCPPDRFPGMIERPLVPPARASAYRCGEAWSLLVTHRASGRRALVQGSAGFVPGALDGQRAEVVYLGVGQLGLRPEDEIAGYWDETVRRVGARRVVLIHWDDFFRRLDRPLRATAYAGDDLDATMRVLGPLAQADGVDLALPDVWRRADPWA